MLIILFLFALIRIPYVVPPQDQDGCHALDIRDTQVHFGQRGVNDIVISCFATIYVCIWCAIHPNVPAPTDCWWTCFKRRIVTMIYALLAPELITTWALRQRLAARRIVNEYNKKVKKISDAEQTNDRKTNSALDTIRGLFQDQPPPPLFQKDRVEEWTLTHGFFLQMGGFMLSEDGRPIQTLADAARPRRHQSPLENEDSTALMWNINNGIIDPPRITADDINDRSKGDPISKSLVILQTTWFIAQCIARWSAGLLVTELEVVTLAFAMLNGITYVLWWDKPQNVGRPVFLESKIPRESYRNLNPEKPPRHAKESRLPSILRKDIHELARSAPWILLGRIPKRILRALIGPMTSLTGNTPSAVRNSDLRVSMFHTAFTDADGKAIIAFTAIGALFGLVHLIPSWFLDFSSRRELWLWRGSSIVITAVPIFVSIMTHLSATKIHDFQIFFISIFIVAPFYVASRIALLTLPLISLHSLTPNALQTIEWTTFIPHL